MVARNKKERWNTLPPTPAQTPSPFYPVSFPPDSDNDLVHVSGHSKAAKAISTRISGRFVDPNGWPMSEARVEIWQCDTNGRYHYVRDGGSIGLVRTISRDTARPQQMMGGYQFLMIKPVPYPGRTPHIHFAVSGRGFERLVTQMYVAGEPGNTTDAFLMGMRDPAARDRLIVGFIQTAMPVQRY